jgi:hypothetical protein
MFHAASVFNPFPCRPRQATNRCGFFVPFHNRGFLGVAGRVWPGGVTPGHGFFDPSAMGYFLLRGSSVLPLVVSPK